MQQRQLRLGDILDDYCPRERRLTNHAVVAMVGQEVKQTRCTTCDAEHEYKHAQVPRPRRKPETPSALAASGTGVPLKRTPSSPPVLMPDDDAIVDDATATVAAHASEAELDVREPLRAEGEVAEERTEDEARDEGPVHRPLIRATLPRIEGQAPPARPATDFTIRQPGGRSSRFRSRHQRPDQSFHGNRNGNGPLRGGARQNAGGRGPAQRPSNRRGPGRRRSK